LTAKTPGGWKIKARLDKKGKIIKHTNGELFKIQLVDDKDGTKIEGIFYTKETPVFHDILEEGRTYFVSKADITVANKKFTSIDHSYSLIFKEHTEFEEIKTLQTDS